MSYQKLINTPKCTNKLPKSNQNYQNNIVRSTPQTIKALPKTTSKGLMVLATQPRLPKQHDYYQKLDIYHLIQYQKLQT